MKKLESRKYEVLSTPAETKGQANLRLLKPAPPSRRPDDRVHVCEKASPAEVLTLALEQNANQIVQQTNHDCDSELKSAIAMINAPEAFLEFPLSTIFTPSEVNNEVEAGHRKLEVFFQGSKEKAAVLQMVNEYVASLPKARMIRDGVSLVADELFTNAVYNAPLTQQEAPISRRSEVNLKSVGKRSRIVIGVSEGRLVLICEDFFGSLDIPRVLSRIKACYENGATQMINFSQNDGGAGIGSFIIFESCMSIYYGVKKDHRTVVACVFPLGSAAKTWDSSVKNVHYVSI